MKLNFQNNREIGKTGEEIANIYLRTKGYKIIKRNLRYKFEEIDIIGKSKNEGVIFFEVKTMLYQKEDGSENKLKPEDNLTKNKVKKIKKIISVFSAKHQKMIYQENGIRIDLVAISIFKDSKKIKIKHFKNI